MGANRLGSFAVEQRLENPAELAAWRANQGPLPRATLPKHGCLRREHGHHRVIGRRSRAEIDALGRDPRDVLEVLGCAALFNQPAGQALRAAAEEDRGPKVLLSDLKIRGLELGLCLSQDDGSPGRQGARALYEEVGATVNEPSEVEDELHQLLESLVHAR